MRSSVSYILSHAPGESIMSHPDYLQQVQHHACLLVLVKGIGGVLKNFNKLWERIQKVDSIKVTDSNGLVREICVRYIRDYPVENNDWGDFQTHRRLLGLITLSKFANQTELNEVCRIHESLKVKYSNTLYDSRAFIFGPGSNIKRPQQEPDAFSIPEDDVSKAGSSCNDKISMPSETADSLSSSESFPQSNSSYQSHDSLTTPSNFKTHAMFYGENDAVDDLEHNVEDLIRSLFWVVESRRLERSREKIDKVALLLAPFEKRDFVGLDMESRNNKKRCMGRVTKNLADLSLQAGLVVESLALYSSAADTLKSVNDWLWLGAAKEGLCAASAMILYPNLRNTIEIHRNASLPEGSPSKSKPTSLFLPNTDVFRKYKLTYSPTKSKNSSPVNPPSDLTPNSSESIDTSSQLSETENADSDSLISSSDIDYSRKSSLLHDLPSISRQQQSMNTQYLLSGEDMLEKYRVAIIHYSKYQNAGIIETEACFKAARIAIHQNNVLQTSGFLQNVIFINLTLAEQEKVQRFDTLAELYTEIGFIRKAAFFQRLAATRQVSAQHPSPDWRQCYQRLLHSFPGYRLSLDPNYVLQHQVGWPALQIQLVHEVVVGARRAGLPALAARHATFLLHAMWPHLKSHERRDLAIQLQSLSAQCEGGPVPLVLDTGEVIPPANLGQVPQCLDFVPKPPAAALAPHLIKGKTQQGPFIFTPIHFGLPEKTGKKDEGKLDILWVENDICQVEMRVCNPLPFELKVSNIQILTSDLVFESKPETVTLASNTPTTINLYGTPKEVGDLQILGYSTHTLGVKSNCRLKHIPMPHKFPPSYTIEVIPCLPTITIETTVIKSGDANPIEILNSNLNITLYNGESCQCVMKITNTSEVAIEFFELSIQSSIDRIFQWSNEEIQSKLPIKPEETVSIPLKLYGEADFLDLGGEGGDNLFPNSLTSAYPSRVGSPLPNAQSSLPTQNSNPQTSLSSGFPNRNLSGSFRSTNSHATSWSAPISVMPPSRGRHLEAQAIIKYSGGKGKETYCRQATVQFSLEFLPSISITHWDVLPAETSSQFYLVLDVVNLTSEEMEFHYTPNKHMLIESKDSCRVPVPLDRCPFDMSIVKPSDQEVSDTRSTSTGGSTNRLEATCSEHITNSVQLKWRLAQSEAAGRACVKGITLSQAMMDIVRMSPLHWEVSVNGEDVSGHHERRCAVGGSVRVRVKAAGAAARGLSHLCLALRPYQDRRNGVKDYSLGARLAIAGKNKVVLETLPETEQIHHECTVVFFNSGEYKIDIECSTTEPIFEEAPLPQDSKLSSIMQTCLPAVNHVWKFTPPLCINVDET